MKGSGGGLIAIEPRYSLINKTGIGLRLETTVVKRVYVTKGSSGNYSGETELKGPRSALATINYQLSRGIRPYIGLGAGLFYIAGTTVALTDGLITDTFDDADDYKPGLMGRTGVKISHLNVVVEYNAIPTSSDAFRGGSIESKTSYVTLKVGVDLGGGHH